MTDDRTFQRRRLAALAGVLALVLAVGSLVGAGQDGSVDVAATASADDAVVRTASVGSPSGVRELLSETTTTLVEATGATTSTTAAPSLALTPTTAVAGDATAPAIDAPAEDAEPVVRALATEGSEPAPPATSEAPSGETTTTAPARSAPATTAPSATTTTTAAPASDSGGYAYDDPRSTQVWYDLARCESGGNWSIDSGNGYYGGLQFSLPTWESVGGTGYPNEHPAATQIEHGRRLHARQGWGAWPHCSEKLGLR